MRIGYLNPWRNAAENQAFRSLQAAAGRIGHEFFHCSNSDEVEVCRPDFVLASASTQPKLNDCPHYAVVHEPRDRFLTDRGYFQNLLTCDGYLTISDSLARFLRDVLYGLGRPGDIGFYYNTCQRQPRAADLRPLLEERRLVVTYFGTNWDHRRSSFFRLLSERDGIQICGPSHSWPDINPKSFGGTPDFDGDSVQARYADNGIGLCLLSDLHLRDDVVSNRIFEITSVGAIAICCDMPWIRRHYGDTVYYIDQGLSDEALVDAITQCVVDIYADPETAAGKARAARAIFERTFAAEILLANAVEYHERMSGRRHRTLARAKESYEPYVSVIIRCGGRPLPLVMEALQSVAHQTYGQFDVILVRYRELDLTQLLVEELPPNVRSVRVVDCRGGGRSATMWTGLCEVRGDYFAILDDDDWWFSDHIERLFQPFPRTPLRNFFAYAGSITEHAESRPIMGGGADRRQLFKFGIEPGGEMFAVSSAFASNCFVASVDLLHEELLIDPDMSTAEDSYLILSLLAQTQPRFSYACTSVHTRGYTEQSDFSRHPRRFEDEMTLRTRLFARHRPPFAKPEAWAELAASWSNRTARTPG
jgi:hypothetical protein